MTLYKDFVKHSSADDMQWLGISASGSIDASGNNSVTFPPGDRYYGSNEWYALSISDKNKVLKACRGINGGKKASKSEINSKSGGGVNNGQGEWKSKITMLEKKVSNKKRHLSVFNTAAKPGSDNEESDDSYKKDGNRKNPALTLKINPKNSKKV